MNVVMIEDEDGEMTDLHYYCSDFCASTDPAYDGWYGCVEADSNEVCEACEAPIPGVFESNGLIADPTVCKICGDFYYGPSGEDDEYACDVCIGEWAAQDA
jgi:hypothetical protein